jgi:hypothetical protein
MTDCSTDRTLSQPGVALVGLPYGEETLPNFVLEVSSRLDGEGGWNKRNIGQISLAG